MTLEELKEVRINEIDETTQTLIFKGFTCQLFPGALFSMSTSAQINLSNIPNLPQGLFPLPWMDKSEQPYEIQYADRMTFYFSALNHKNTHLQSGSVLKSQIKAAQTEQEVLDVNDNRYQE